MSDDRKQKKLDSLRKSVENGRDGNAKGNQRDSRIMYRGRPVPGGGGGGAPGSPGSGGGGRPQSEQRPSSDGGDDIQQAITKLNQLFSNGLINKSEYEAKKAEILNRL